MSNNIAKTGDTNCKIVSYSSILKTRGTDRVYQEAIEASSKFNKRLANERKMRIPFLDSQTTVAQANCMIWHMEYERSKSNRDGYVYSYPVKHWYKTRRLAFENDSSNMLHRLQLPSEIVHQQMLLNENSNHSSIDTHHHHHHHGHHHHNHHNHHHQPHVLAKQTSNPNDDYGSRLDEWHDDFMDPTNDNDADSDGEDYEDSKRGKKKRAGGGGGGRSKKGIAKEAPVNGDDKPFVCDKCGVKYKTKPGLTYHIQKAHSNVANTPTHHSSGSKSHDLIENENTNSVFDSVYDDTSSSMPQPSSISNNNNGNTNGNNTTNFSTTILANIHSSNSSSLSKTNVNKCGVCLGSEQESKSGQHEPFVSCCECTKSFHPLCLNFTPNMIKSVKKYKWQCIECKRCTICGNSENDDKLLFCDDCDRGYHMYCLNPPLTTAPEGDWRCDLCIKQFGNPQS